ncbi:MAG: alginate lyase family protein, partial [Ignavibacteria bacterium]|nr:alginate lyase family protein [Ignavibacteria bacterium]
NNHGISESVGLWTIGLLFPEFKNAKNWKKKGKAYLEKLADQLIYRDGTFVQHSVNYHRLMLHDYIWAIRLGQLNGESFSDKLTNKIQNAAEFLYRIQNSENGYVPNYGKNDGALILPLDNCNYRDYRPVIQSAYYLTTGFRCYESGPADESLFWLFGSEALKTAVKPPKQTNLIAEDGGYYTIRTDKSFIFTRCASYKHRPSDSDMLHVDLWWKGINIALDPGTYSYNAPNFWKDGLAGTAFHNSVTVDNLDQMDKISSFLWLPWLKSKLLTSKISKSKLVEYWEGHHKGYCRIKSPVIHSRGIIRIGDEHWIILDRLSSKKKHGYRLHWLLQNYPYEWKDDEGQIVLKTRKGSFVVQIGVIEAKPNYSLIKGDPESPRGWKSSYYYAKEPAISVDASVVGENRLFWTVLGPEGFVIDSGQGTLNLKTETWKSSITINDHRQKLIVSDISLSSGKYEKLNIS